MLSASDFGAFHAAVHGGHQPFAWQQRLLQTVVGDGSWPTVLDLPTGAGKTTCIDIALFALALDAQKPLEERWCPRRIAMVVDRRIVVDQAAERGRKLLRALVESDNPVVREVAARLQRLGGEDEPIGVYTLRGGMPKDDGWARTPAQPLIIASTVDQIGSRMLMQGYGVRAGMRPIHAGLLANDTLLLLDEVHLSEPFRQTLDQLRRLRTRFEKGDLKTRFSHVFLSATPGAETNSGERFTLSDNETAEDSLRPRLDAKKPAKLVTAKDRDELESKCVNEAVGLLERHHTIAVVVNRVASAAKIAQALGTKLGAEAIVTLLTGRMRPLDRDDVLSTLRPAVQTGRVRAQDLPKRVVVGTQCIEAGADFDFDALVTEAASLDSLKQRFGRVDRLGRYGKAEGVIVRDKSIKKSDPVYGDAIEHTFKELRDKIKPAGKEKAADGTVDFCVSQLPNLVASSPELLAPKPTAPTLLPTYLNLWAQTSPAPAEVPDVSLWLHGPASGPADVQVVWRADLSENLLRSGAEAEAAAVVGAVRPSSLEAVPLPFAVARAWLAGLEVAGYGDTEGEPAADDTERAPPRADRPALRWRGDESDIIDHNKLRPADTIVVPTAYGGIRNGCFDPDADDPVSDLAERAELLARGRPMLRLHPDVVAGLGLALSLDDEAEAREQLKARAADDSAPAWMRLWADKLANGRGEFVVPGDPPWTVIEGKRVALQELRKALAGEASAEVGVEITTDAEDSYRAGVAVTLAAHSGHVEQRARAYAEACGLNKALVEHLAFAAWLHDIGKADQRFQIMLRGGSEIEWFKDETPLAKSAMSPGAREARHVAGRRAGYPTGARHEVQSVAMIQAHIDKLRERLRSAVNADTDLDMDLVLHLVASHHGYCRPFAPAIPDDHPVDVSLAGHASNTFGPFDFAATTSDHRLYRLDSPIGDRFWGRIETYGWMELCWLEAVLRLADHRASEEEQNA